MKKTCLIVSFAFIQSVLLLNCSKIDKIQQAEMRQLIEHSGLEAELISIEKIGKGEAIKRFVEYTGVEYKPSYNEDPAIPAQCWIETGYGTQNACKYCHTNYLTNYQHGNNFPIAEDQILYSFPSPNLNRVNWRNVIAPNEIMQRLRNENIPIPESDDPENFIYVRKDNWRAAFMMARPNGDDTWNNLSNDSSHFQLFPALNPNDLYPYTPNDPTEGGIHGYIDQMGFVRNRRGQYTGWRAVNFFPYAIFTPLTGSVSGIYIRLPGHFRRLGGDFDIDIYLKNLDLLEKNIKNQNMPSIVYYGDASHVAVQKGFYPVGTEFAHPLHYVDLEADGESGIHLDGLNSNPYIDYEFPGTRSKRVKEIRYMYKWKEVSLSEIGPSEYEIETVIGKEWKGWIDNGVGWILAAYIEDRYGELRPQTTEELLQCKGCHSSVGNTIDAVWSFQRKLPGDLGWQDMDYGNYHRSRPEKTRLQDYYGSSHEMGELEYFYYTVVGADLFGVMPEEIENELVQYTRKHDLIRSLNLENDLQTIFDDEELKTTTRDRRQSILYDRMRIMRHYAASKSYLYHDPGTGSDYIKGSIFYPSEKTMLANIAGYRRIVLDQSYNLGKNVFGLQPEAIPFTFRSDGEVLNSDGEMIPAGQIIESRPWGRDGVGVTPTGIALVNEDGEPVDANGNVVDIDKNPEHVVGHISTGGTFETMYNPILSEKPVRK